MNRMQGKQRTAVGFLKVFVFPAISGAAALPTPDLVAGQQAYSDRGAALDLRFQTGPALWQAAISNVDLDIQELKDLALQVQHLQDGQDDRDGHGGWDMTNVWDRDDLAIEVKRDLRLDHRLDLLAGARVPQRRETSAAPALAPALALVLGAIAAPAALAYRRHRTLGSPRIGPQTLLLAVLCCPLVLMFPIDESADAADAEKLLHPKSEP